MTKPKIKIHDMNGVPVPARARTLTMGQREIIAEGWQDYIDGKLTVVDISTAAGVSYETTRVLLSEMSKTRRVNASARSREVNRRRNSDASSMRRPRGVTAPPFTDDWFEQNQKSAEKHFKACISSGHWQFFNEAT